MHRVRNEKTFFLFDKALLITKKRGDHFVYKGHIPVTRLLPSPLPSPPPLPHSPPSPLRQALGRCGHSSILLRLRSLLPRWPQ